MRPANTAPSHASNTTRACNWRSRASSTRTWSAINDDCRGVRTLDSIAAIDAADWNACLDEDFPFAEHAWLHALEDTGCVSPATGWSPRHLVLEDTGGRITGVAPAYLKSHSYGEFVFDFAWASLHHRLGRDYYPKLVIGIPFTPCPGPRLLGRTDAAAHHLALSLPTVARDCGASSAHVLFHRPQEASALHEAGFFGRRDIRFEWFNRGHADFDEYLGSLKSARRKSIRRERRKLAEAGIDVRMHPAGELDDADFSTVCMLYARTYHVRGQEPYLTADFWRRIRALWPQRLLVAVARDEGGALVAAALFVRGRDTLFGRHWGSGIEIPGLHFETCYYQGIEYCLTHGLQRFDAGVQGGHKHFRGFDAVQSRSAHWCAEPALHKALERACAQETKQIQAYCEELDSRTTSRPSS